MKGILYAIDCLCFGKVYDLETLNIGITIASHTNLDLEVDAYQIGEGNEGSLKTDESIVDLLSQASEISQNCVELESYFLLL